MSMSEDVLDYNPQINFRHSFWELDLSNILA